MTHYGLGVGDDIMQPIAHSLTLEVSQRGARPSSEVCRQCFETLTTAINFPQFAVGASILLAVLNFCLFRNRDLVKARRKVNRCGTPHLTHVAVDDSEW